MTMPDMRCTGRTLYFGIAGIMGKFISPYSGIFICLNAFENEFELAHFQRKIALYYTVILFYVLIAKKMCVVVIRDESGRHTGV